MSRKVGRESEQPPVAALKSFVLFEAFAQMGNSDSAVLSPVELDGGGPSSRVPLQQPGEHL